MKNLIYLGVDDLTPINVDGSILVTELGWQGSSRKALDNHLNAIGLELSHTREIRKVLSQIQYPMINGELPLVGSHLLVGTLRNLNKGELKKLGLNEDGVRIVQKLFPSNQDKNSSE